MYQAELKSLKQKFEQVISKLSEDFASVRTGRASASLVESIPVSYYGSTMPLKQMATITSPDASQIVVQPWDKNALSDIELAIRNSETGLSPVNDGQFIRVSVPSLTEERRHELLRVISRKGEEGRVALRGARGEVWDKIRKMEKDGLITEDDRYAAETNLNDLISEYNKKIEFLVQDKEKELKTI